MSGHFNIGPAHGPRLRRGDDSAADHAADFDALTDLFMGEVNAPPARPDVHPPVRRAPVLRLASEEDLSDWDDDSETPAAPAAIAPLPPAPATNAAPVARGRTESRGDGAPNRPSAEPAIVECIVLGNLPVYGAAWAAQYVREVARAAGRPVAYLRLQSGYASVELVGGADAGAPQACATLEDAVKHAAARTYRWVLRADLGEEPRVAASPLVRVVTLLTGVDETAVLGAYTSIKSLAAELAAETDARDVAIRVAVMGATPKQAEPACARLAEAARRFLGRDVQHAVCGAKVSASRPADVLFSGRTDLRTADVMALLSQLLGAPAAAAPDMPAASEPAPAESSTLDELIDGLGGPDIDDALDEAYAEPEVAPVAAARPAPVREPAQPATAASAPPAQARSARQDNAAAVAQAAATAAVTDVEPVGALALLLDGLRPVSVLCPYAPGVELALDASGGLHLLVRAEPDDGDDGEQKALSQLLVASAWAEAHAMLLVPALAATGAPAAHAAATQRPVAHLFTDRPKRSRRLLETDVRVHLLARVNIGGQSGWYCTALN